MENRRKSKGIIAVIIVPIVLFLLIGGVFGLVYSLVTSADKNGNMIAGTWNYNNETALVVDIDKSTYTLSVDSTNESGTIKKVDLLKNDSNKGVITYQLTLDGNGEYLVDISIDYNGDDKMVMDFHSNKTNKSYKFIEILNYDK
ncbi:MAG: hypothetical protein RR630_02830 [Coprobacillus sp.]